MLRWHVKSSQERKDVHGNAAAQIVMWAGCLASPGCEHEAAQVLSEAGFDVD